MNEFDEATLAYYCAHASNQAYEDNPADMLGDEWTKLGISEDKEWNYKAVAYIHQFSKLILLAHRGTVATSLKNLLIDIKLALGDGPSSTRCSTDYSSSIRIGFPEYQVIETGHSLGGFYAEFNGIKLNHHSTKKVITFDSPGVPEEITCNLNKGKKDLFKELFVHYLSAPNIVNTLHPHVGKSVRLFLPFKKDKSDGCPDIKLTPKHFNEVATLGMDIYTGNVKPGLEGASSIANLQLVQDGLRVGQDVVQEEVNHESSLHSLTAFIKAFDPVVKIPYVQQDVVDWPCLSKMINYLIRLKHVHPVEAVLDRVDASRDFSSQNRRYEANQRHHLRDCYSLAEEVSVAPCELLSSQHSQYAPTFYKNVVRTFRNFHTEEQVESLLRPKIPENYWFIIDNHYGSHSANVPVVREQPLGTCCNTFFRTMATSASLDSRPTLSLEDDVGGANYKASVLERNATIDQNHSVVSILGVRHYKWKDYEILGVPVNRGDLTRVLIEKLNNAGQVERKLFHLNLSSGSAWLIPCRWEVAIKDVTKLSDLRINSEPTDILASSSWVLTADKTARLLERLTFFSNHPEELPKFKTFGAGIIHWNAVNCLTFFQKRFGEEGVDAVNHSSKVNWFVPRPQDHIGYVGQYNRLTPLNI